MGKEQSRRDDLESIGFILIYLLKGALPWQGLRLKKAEDITKAITRIKEATLLNDLCKDLPLETLTYMQYCRSLEFEQQPNYDFLIELFSKVLKTLDIKMDVIEIDWSLLKKVSVIRIFILYRRKSQNRCINQLTKY